MSLILGVVDVAFTDVSDSRAFYRAQTLFELVVEALVVQRVDSVDPHLIIEASPLL